MKLRTPLVLAAVGSLLGLSVQAAQQPYLGVTTSPLSPVLAEQLNLGEGVGLVVEFIDPDSPAAESLQQHDVLHKVDNQLLVSQYQLAVLIRRMDAGEKVTLTVIRGGKPVKVPVTLASRELPPLPPPQPWGPGGMNAPPPPFGPALGGGNNPDVMETLQDFMDRLNRAGQAFDLDGWIQQFQNQPTPPSTGPAGPDEDKIIIELNDEAGQPNDENHPGATASSTSRMTVQIKHDGQSLTRQVTLVENDLEVVVKEQDGEKHLLATRDGKELFDGPVNTDEERKAVPDIVKPLLERAEGGVNTTVIQSGKTNRVKKPERKVLSL